MSRTLILLAAFSTSACVVDRLDFHEQPNAELTGPDGAGSGGAAGSDSSSSGPGGESARSLPFLRGGYGGGETTVEAIAEGLPRGTPDPRCWGANQNATIEGVYDDVACEAGTVCLFPCTGANVIEGDACEFQLTDGTAPGVCRGTPGFFHCVLPCSADSECPAGSACFETPDRGSMCMIPETPDAAVCNPDYCLEEGPQHGLVDSRPWYCNVDAPCCDGLSCSPEGECQNRACLPNSWTCSDSGAPCCDGLTCNDGYCEPA